MTTIDASIWETQESTMPLIVWTVQPSVFLDLQSKKQGWTDLFAPDCTSFDSVANSAATITH